jgi:PAP2 superfamily
MLKQVWNDHRAVVQVLAAFFALAGGYFTWLGRWDWWQFRWSYPVFVVIALLGCAIRLLAARIRHGAASPVWTGRSLLGAGLVLALVCPFQSTFNSLKQTLDDVRGFPWDVTLARADAWLHGGRQPWEWLQPLVGHLAVMRWVDRVYMAWFPVLLVFLLWVAWTPDRALRQRTLVAALLTWIVCGVLLAFVFPSAGPCYYGAVTGMAIDPFAPLMAQLRAHEAQGFLFATFNQRGLWAASQQDVWLPFGGISAMPSLHVGMAVLMALVIRARGRLIGGLAWLYAIAVHVGAVALGWHYAVDGYLAGACAFALWRLSALADFVTTCDP